jgi:hypothetical protein
MFITDNVRETDFYSLFIGGCGDDGVTSGLSPKDALHITSTGSAEDSVNNLNFYSHANITQYYRALYINDQAATKNEVRRIRFKNSIFHPDLDGTVPPPNSSLIELGSCQDVTFDDCVITAFGRDTTNHYGIKIDGNGNGQAVYVKIVGGYIGGFNPANTGTGGSGLFIGDASQVSVIGGTRITDNKYNTIVRDGTTSNFGIVTIDSSTRIADLSSELYGGIVTVNSPVSFNIEQNSRPIRVVSGVDTIDVKDSSIRCINGTSYTVTLPDVSLLWIGKKISITKANSSNTITVATNGLEQIDFASTKALATTNRGFEVEWDGAQWSTINSLTI